MANEQKHTPGPWDVVFNRPNISVWSPTGKVAQCAISLDSPPAPVGAANARLIAAAPDLLASLTELVNSPNAKANAMWDRARAALSKAA